MAKLIPEEIVVTTESYAERRMFEMFRDETGSSAWTVLHSLALKKRHTGPFGEIDFVVLIPKVGILCLEVKGGEVACRKGEWESTGRDGITHKLKSNPFVQARNAMFGMKQELLNRTDAKSRMKQIPIDSAVAFPDVTWKVTGDAAIYADSVIDAKDLNDSISDAVMRIVRKSEVLGDRSRAKQTPSAQEIDEIAQILRPDFELDLSIREYLERNENQLFTLTEEQEGILGNLRKNPRCIITGSAGTGKSVLATTYANEAAEQGNQVLLMCYNYLLADSLKNRVTSDKIKVGNVHELIRQFVKESDFEKEFWKAQKGKKQNKIYSEIYPEYGQLALEAIDTQFDVLILDETQDLMTKPYLNFFNHAIVNGLKKGTWRMFGDFNRQMIYGRKTGPEEALEEYGANYAQFDLSTNCRNSIRIAKATMDLTGADMPPKSLDQFQGLEVDYQYWSKTSTLQEKLDSIVNRLSREQICKSRITILGPKAYKRSSLAKITHVGGSEISMFERGAKEDTDSIKYSTIQAFKGMENSVVILVDLDFSSSDYAESLLYVGMSRARSMLILFVNDQYRPELDRRLRESMN